MVEIFFGKYVFRLEWKSEGVMDDDSGDSEEDEDEGNWLRQGWRSETGSFSRDQVSDAHTYTVITKLFSWHADCRYT